jgi:hypothetical protein
LAAGFPETAYYREDLAESLCDLGVLLHHKGGYAEEEEALRRSIGISKEIIAWEPDLVYRRMIITKGLIALAMLEWGKGQFGASKVLFSDARSHLQAGLAINPLDPQLKELKKEIESNERAKDTREPAGLYP